jgi:hypothetical protein
VAGAWAAVPHVDQLAGVQLASEALVHCQVSPAKADGSSVA